MALSRDSSLLFEELMSRHLDLVYHVARSWCGDATEAEDLTQVAFMKAFRNFQRFEPGTNFKAWILGILRNALIDAKRAEKRQPETVSIHAMAATHEPEAVEPPLESLDIESREVFYDLFGDEVARLLQQIPETFSLPVLLFDVEGLNYQEIAAILDCPVGTVRSRLHRGRLMLQERLRDYAKSIGYLKEAAS